MLKAKIIACIITALLAAGGTAGASSLSIDSDAVKDVTEGIMQKTEALQEIPEQVSDFFNTVITITISEKSDADMEIGQVPDGEFNPEGQAPEDLPEIPDGELPPELPDGQQFADEQLPPEPTVFEDGELPADMPEIPDGEFNPEGQAPEDLPEIPDGEFNPEGQAPNMMNGPMGEMTF